MQAEKANRGALRRDINGLRAIAVVLVLVDHTFGVPRGGYLGVDIFFVLSGFLITGLLLREHERTGRISFADFYRRRARRILPAATLVIAVTVATAQVLFLANRAHDVTVDGLWSLLFFANLHFALEGADYFNATGPVSPFQHYWSLGVEEQFYFVWPLLVVACLLLARRAHVQRLRVFAIVAGFAAAASFAWGYWHTRTAPSAAYFDTLARGWELGLGALLAVGALRLARLGPGRWRAPLAWTGLVVLVVGALRLTPLSPVPAPAAAIPVLGAAAIVAAGTGATPPRLLHLLDNPVAQYLGLISFSLYLWHWPVIVYLSSVMAPSPSRSLTVLAVTIALSVLSFHLVEDPVRTSSWLEPRVRRAGSGPRLGDRIAPPAAIACLASVVVLAGLTSAFALNRVPAHALPSVASADDPAPGGAAGDDTEAGRLGAAVTTALRAESWPALEPSLDSLGEATLAAPWVKDDCLDVNSDEDLERCGYGDASGSQLAVVIGDSVATSYLPGIIDALAPSGWRVQPLTLQACPAAAVAVNDFQGALWTPCEPHRAWLLDQVARLKPQLVVVSSAEDSLDRLVSGATGQAALDEWRDGLTATLTSLQALVPDIVVLGAPPAGQDPRTCATAQSTPADCISEMHTRWWEVSDAEQAAVAAVATPGVRYVDVHTWFCSERGYCPAFADDTPVRSDPNHLTDAYSHHLAGALGEALLPPAPQETPAPST